MARQWALSRWFPVAVVLLAIGLWLGWAWFVTGRYPESAEMPPEALQAVAARGQFGDLFGGVNALFTALILAGAVYTVWLQHAELDDLKRQQADARRDNARTAVLMAQTALVNARSSLLNARYQIAKDLSPKIATADETAQVPLIQMLQANAEMTGKLFNELEASAKELSALAEEIRSERDGPRLNA